MKSTSLRDISHVTDWLVRPLVVIGHAGISILKIATIILSVVLTVAAAKFLKRRLVSSVHDPEIRSALGNILQYLIVFFGSLVVLQSAGIDLSILTVLSGTIGLGIGFGLQRRFATPTVPTVSGGLSFPDWKT